MIFQGHCIKQEVRGNQQNGGTENKRIMFEKWSVEGNAVLDQNKSFDYLLVPELEKFLFMYHFINKKPGNKGEKQKN